MRPARMAVRALAVAASFLACMLCTGVVPPAAAQQSERLLDFTPAEIGAILKHGPWPPARQRDPTNRASGDPAAVELGRALFFDARLSADGKVSCATCHQPERSWTDGRPVAVGIETSDRNTPSLFDVALNRWHGWDGAGDSLWAQSIRPILDSREMGGSAERTAAAIAGDAGLAAAYRSVFGSSPREQDARSVLVGAGKALAAFQETIASPRSPFDAFSDALARGDGTAAASYPISAQRGLRIFIGKGSCTACHLGPRFTNDEFADIGIPFFTAAKGVDPGRHGGITRLKANPFNLLGRYNDDPARASAWTTAQVDRQHRNWGEFKVPSLRGVARTAPYMHNGLLLSLEAVVRYYSEIDESRLHVHGERILRPLGLSPAEVADLVAFLETL